ncbi:MAG: hypothetical protein PVF43_02565 [Candidatus Eiseniibacteriota bacterium]
MLGRFIVPAARLTELDAHAELLRDPARGPCRFSVLVGGGRCAGAAGAALRDHLALLRRFRAHHGDAVRVDVLETRLPDDVAASGDPAPTVRYLESALEAITDPRDVDGLELFVEIAGPAAGREQVEAAIEGAAGVARRSPGGLRLGIKLRCGGVEPGAFPTPERVASVLGACHARGLPLKCTAGLHHPLRHPAPDIGAGVVMHGFVNVFGAGVLLDAGALRPDTLATCLADQEAGSFRFDGATFAWREARCDARQINTARRRFMTSYGSCSFDEPRDDLRALGWLPAT